MTQWEVSFDNWRGWFQVMGNKDDSHQTIVEIFMGRNPIFHKGSPHIPTKVWVRKANEPETVKVFNAYVVWSITETTPQTKKGEVNHGAVGS